MPMTEKTFIALVKNFKIKDSDAVQNYIEIFNQIILQVQILDFAAAAPPPPLSLNVNLTADVKKLLAITDDTLTLTKDEEKDSIIEALNQRAFQLTSYLHKKTQVNNYAVAAAAADDDAAGAIMSIYRMQQKSDTFQDMHKNDAEDLKKIIDKKMEELRKPKTLTTAKFLLMESDFKAEKQLQKILEVNRGDVAEKQLALKRNHTAMIKIQLDLKTVIREQSFINKTKTMRERLLGRVPRFTDAENDAAKNKIKLELISHEIMQANALMLKLDGVREAAKDKELVMQVAKRDCDTCLGDGEWDGEKYTVFNNLLTTYNQSIIAANKAAREYTELCGKIELHKQAADKIYALSSKETAIAHRNQSSGRTKLIFNNNNQFNFTFEKVKKGEAVPDLHKADEPVGAVVNRENYKTITALNLSPDEEYYFGKPGSQADGKFSLKQTATGRVESHSTNLTDEEKQQNALAQAEAFLLTYDLKRDGKICLSGQETPEGRAEVQRLLAALLALSRRKGARPLTMKDISCELRGVQAPEQGGMMSWSETNIKKYINGSLPNIQDEIEVSKNNLSAAEAGIKQHYAVTKLSDAPLVEGAEIQYRGPSQ